LFLLLEKVGLSTTLVATVRKGVNDGEIGDVLRHAAQWRYVRGVNFQPVQDTGRNEGFVADQNRIVSSEIRRAILDQGGVRRGRHDPVAVQSGCDFDRLRVARRHCDPTGDASLSAGDAGPRGAELGDLREPSRNARPLDRAVVIVMCRPALGGRFARDPVLPPARRAAGLARLRHVSFLDRFNFCLAGVKRSCIHFVTPDDRIIPFDTYNLLHRQRSGPA
jgi:7,8-dihydro-6-hydroxymethylpterin dimethyltransferase